MNMGVLIKIIKDYCIVAGIPAMFGIAGFLMLPAVLKSKLPQIMEQTAGGKATLGKVEINPILMQFSLQGFSLSEPNGKPFAAFDNFSVNLDLWRSIKESALVIEQVLLIKPIAHIVKQKDGQFNFNRLLKVKAETEKKDNKILPLIIDNISLSEGKLAWEDVHSVKPVNEEIYPINLAIKNFSIQEDVKQFPVNLTLALKSGGKLDWQGVAGVNPVSSSGRIKLDSVDLNRILELAAANIAKFDLKGKGLLELDYKVGYTKQVVDLVIDRSRLKVQEFQFTEKEHDNLKVNIQDSVLEGEYKFSYADSQWRLKTDKSKLELNNIQLPGLGKSKTLLEIPTAALEAGYQADNTDNRINFVLTGNRFELNNSNLTEMGESESLVKIPSFSVKGIALNLEKKTFSVEAVKADKASFKAWLNSDGKFNYQNLFPVTDTKENHPEAVDPTPEGGGADWKISIKNTDLENFALAFEDRTLEKTVSFNAEPIDIKLGNYTNQSGTSVPAKLSAGINETGSIKLTGDAVAGPYSARLSVAINEIALERFQAYINKFARLDIVDGSWNAAGMLSIALPTADKPEIKFQGNSGIAGLLTRDQILNKDFVKWKNLSFQDIDADVKAHRYTAKRLVIERPYARVVIAKDKSVNVSDVFMTAKTKPAGSTRIKKIDKLDKEKPYFKLDKIQVIDGSSDFADLSLILPFAAQIKSLDGGASGISSEKKSTVKVSLKGNAYDLAPVDIKGDISPYLGNFNIDLNFQGMPMPLVSPYMVQFAGYKVEKGKLTLGLNYKVENRQLTASNSILIDQFELGEKVENPNAVSVPLELAVALLKDSSGKIKMDVPITGSLEDPKFSLGKIIGKALLNSITKIISSPFKAIASLIGSKEDMSSISFASGKSDLDKKQQKKLDDLIKLLKERPVLTFEIKGAAFQQDDWPALREAALYDQLKKQKAAEVVKNGGKKILAEYIELSDEEYKRLLADKFIEKFPLLAEKSLFGTPRLIHPDAGDFYVVAKQKLAEIIKPEENRLKHLAEERAQAVAKYILQKGEIPNDRIYILDTAIDPERDTKEIVSKLSLKTN
jgi:outer membrane protein OmpA-like peptidoglycan-associated protein